MRGKSFLFQFCFDAVYTWTFKSFFSLFFNLHVVFLSRSIILLPFNSMDEAPPTYHHFILFFSPEEIGFKIIFEIYIFCLFFLSNSIRHTPYLMIQCVPRTQIDWILIRIRIRQQPAYRVSELSFLISTISIFTEQFCYFRHSHLFALRLMSVRSPVIVHHLKTIGMIHSFIKW